MNQKVSVLLLHSSVTPQIKKLAAEMESEFAQEGHSVHLTDDISGFSESEISSFDLICVGTEDGNRNLDQTSRLLDHPQIAAFSSCRRSLFTLRKKADKLNVHIGDLALFPIKKGLFYPLNAWLTYRKHGSANPDFEGFNMYPHGIPDEELDRARSFAKNLCTQLTVQRESQLVYS